MIHGNFKRIAPLKGSERVFEGGFLMKKNQILLSLDWELA
jgi:hypothetical protein